MKENNICSAKLSNTVIKYLITRYLTLKLKTLFSRFCYPNHSITQLFTYTAENTLCVNTAGIRCTLFSTSIHRICKYKS